jgi:hypothetical protein
MLDTGNRSGRDGAACRHNAAPGELAWPAGCRDRRVPIDACKARFMLAARCC